MLPLCVSVSYLLRGVTIPTFQLGHSGAICEMKVMLMTVDDKFHVSCFTVEHHILTRKAFDGNGSALGSRSSLATQGHLSGVRLSIHLSIHLFCRSCCSPTTCW